MASLWQTFLTNSEFLILKMLLSSYNPDHAQLKDRPKKKALSESIFQIPNPKTNRLVKIKVIFLKTIFKNHQKCKRENRIINSKLQG